MSQFKKDGIAASVIAFFPVILTILAVAATVIYHGIAALLH